MDKLLVDIDQVLDDLEESEKHQAATNYAFSQARCLSLKDEISSIQNQSLHHQVSSGDQPNDQSKVNDKSKPSGNSDGDLQSASQLTDESPADPPSIGKSTSPFKPTPVNDFSIYESNYEPTYESFRKLNLTSTSSPTEQSPNDEANFFDSSFSNRNHDKSSDNSVSSAVDKSSTHSSNQNANGLNDDPPISSGKVSSLPGGDKAVPNSNNSASLSDTTRTCEQSNTQLDEQTSEKRNANLDQQPLCDNLLLSDSYSSPLLADHASAGPSVLKEHLDDFDCSFQKGLEKGLESAIICDKDKRSATASSDQQTSVSSKDDLLTDQGSKCSINKMSNNPFEPDEASAGSSRNPFEDDDHNLDSNLGCSLSDDNDAYDQRSANAEETHLADSSCSVNSRPLTGAPENATNSTAGIAATPQQRIQQSGPSTSSCPEERSTATDPADSSFSQGSTANGHQTGVQLPNDRDTSAASNSLLDSYESSETVNTSQNGADNLSHEISASSANVDHLFLNSVGYVKPYWIPDKEAPACMFCSTKFNLLVRRHHCRSCGQVFCSSCCHYYIKLPYLNYKEGRICQICVNLLDCFKDGEVDSRRSSRTSSILTQQQNPSVLDLSTGASTTMGAIMPTTSSQIRPMDDGSASSPILVPVLKKLDRVKEPQAAKQVIFEDGIRPGGDLTESNCQSTAYDAKPSGASSSVSNFPTLSTFSTLLFPSSSGTAGSPKSSQLDEHQPAIASTAKKSTKNKNLSYTVILQDLNGKLPPLVNSTPLLPESTFADLIAYLDADEKNYLRFQITKNLCINVYRTKLDCCTQMVCWVFTSDGLSSFGQDEILIVLEGLDAEIYFPRDVLRLYLHVFDNAFKGKPMSDLNLMLFEDGLFENRDNSGFIFFRPTFQCLKKIQVPQSPFLVGLGILKWEIPWAKSLPLRLLLRLGAQTGCYPCPIVSQRSRPSTFHEIGHTIMNVLADFRNFQYTLPFIPGLNVHLIPTDKKRKIVVKIAKNRHDLVLKALNSSNDYVLAFGSNLELNANYHLTCGQNDDQYLTQILCRKDGRVEDFSLNNLEKSTEYISELIGASYIVFSGALKSEPGLNCKFSLVEDGVLVQLLPSLLEKLKNSLKQKTDFNLNCNQNSSSEVDEVQVLFTDDDLNFNIGVVSQIDGRSLEGVQSIRIYNGSDCIGERYLIRWTELFFLQYDQRKSINSMDYTRMAGTRIAQQLLVTLTPHLSQLVKESIKKISLRVNLNPDDVDNYAVATNVGPMPNNLTTELDSGLIPLIIQLQGNSANELDQALIIELIFFILNK